MEPSKPERKIVNIKGTRNRTDTPATRGCSGPVLWEIVGADGTVHGPFDSTKEATDYAKREWPDQEQIDDVVATGWDLRIAGSER